MLTLEQAAAIARSRKTVINECHEYEQAYHFIDNTYNGDGDSGVVVLKESGEAISFVQFILTYHPEKIFQVIDI